MAALTPSLRQFGPGLRCVRHTRLLSSTAAARDEALSTPTPTPTSAPTPDPTSPPAYMQAWGTLDPQMVENKKLERRLLRRDHVQPVGSRRRRAALRRGVIQNAVELPFEQLPYQCFQEARKFLQEDRMEKLKEIKHQQQRIQAVAASDASEQSKRDRIARMKMHTNDLIIQADINDPTVKRKFEDGQGMWKSCVDTDKSNCLQAT